MYDIIWKNRKGVANMAIDEQKAVERARKQFARQNKFISENYDRQTVTLKKGTKDRIKATGESVNGFINRLVMAELDRIEGNQNENQNEN